MNESQSFAQNTKKIVHKIVECRGQGKDVPTQEHQNTRDK